MLNFARAIYYLLTLFVIGFLYWCYKFPPAVPPQGIVLQTAAAAQSISPDLVKIYSSDAYQAQGKLLGVINLESFAGSKGGSEDKSSNDMANYGAQLAASIGANVLVVDGEGYDPVMQAYMMTAKAYNVQNPQ